MVGPPQKWGFRHHALFLVPAEELSSFSARGGASDANAAPIFDYFGPLDEATFGGMGITNQTALLFGLGLAGLAARTDRKRLN